MKQFKTDQKVWHYNYENGLCLVSICDDKINVSGYTTILFNGKKLIVLLKQLFETEKLARDYSTAINFKRGWLEREFEKHPDNIDYQIQKKDSIESFPELWL